MERIDKIETEVVDREIERERERNGEESGVDRVQLPWDEGGTEGMRKRREEDVQLPFGEVRLLGGGHNGAHRHRRFLHPAHWTQHPPSPLRSPPIR